MNATSVCVALLGLPVAVYSFLTLSPPIGGAVFCRAATVFLVCVFAARWFRSVGWGVAAALLFLLTPSPAVVSRIADVADVWSVPLVLGWALGVSALADAPSRVSASALAAGMASLFGILYAHPRAAVTLPFFLLATIVLWERADGWRLRDALPAVVTAAAVLLPLAAWWWHTPAASAALVRHSILEPADLRSMYRASTVLKGFWDYLTPSRLFLNPRAAGLCGVLLSSSVWPLATGMMALTRRPPDGRDPHLPDVGVAVFAGCMAGPIIAAIYGSGSPGETSMFVPFAVVLTTFGARRIWHRGRVHDRVVLILAAVAAALQAVVCFSA